jgi:hypothetical protein
VAGVAWARWKQHRLDVVLTSLWIAYLALLPVAIWRSGTILLPSNWAVLFFVLTAAVSLVHERRRGYTRAETRLIEAATTEIPDDGRPVELRARHTFAARVTLGFAIAVGVALGLYAVTNAGPGLHLPEPRFYVFGVLAAALMLSQLQPLRRDGLIGWLDSHGLTLLQRRVTVPWRYVVRATVDVRGEPSLRWRISDLNAVVNASEGNRYQRFWLRRHIVRNDALDLPIRAMRGGPELAIQATARYLAVERSPRESALPQLS